MTIEENVPRWMKEQGVTGGWITAEYSMLPYSTLQRKPRDITKGKIDGRSQEIQRLIGRAMRAALDLDKLGQRTICVDCDVLQADGGPVDPPPTVRAAPERAAPWTARRGGG